MMGKVFDLLNFSYRLSLFFVYNNNHEHHENKSTIRRKK